MPKAPLYNAEGKEAGTIDLSDAVFGVKAKQTVVHQVYTALEANKRQPWAHVKDRSEVRGGGKKPWKQKGTGRARHGSIRSPIWTGGGVTFGPRKNRNYKQKINKKTNQLAVKMCLSDKVKDAKLVIVEAMPESGKTKDMRSFREALPGSGKSTLVLGNDGAKVGLSLRNIPSVHLQRAIDLNVADLLNHQYIIASKEAVEILEKRLA